MDKIVVSELRAGSDEGASEACFQQLVLREFRQGIPRMIFVFANDENHMRPFVGLKMKWNSTEKIGAGNRGTPILVNVINDQISPRKVADVRRHTGVIHRINHVAHKDD